MSQKQSSLTKIVAVLPCLVLEHLQLAVKIVVDYIIPPVVDQSMVQADQQATAINKSIS